MNLYVVTAALRNAAQAQFCPGVLSEEQQLLSSRAAAWL